MFSRLKKSLFASSSSYPEANANGRSRAHSAVLSPPPGSLSGTPLKAHVDAKPRGSLDDLGITYVGGRARLSPSPILPTRERDWQSAVGDFGQSVQSSGYSGGGTSSPVPRSYHETPVIRSGFLTIDEGDQGWKRYWFVLSGSTVGNVALRYYSHTEAARDGPISAIATLFLKGSRVVVIQEMIRISAESAEEWFVCADSAKLGKDWADDIELASRSPERCSEAAGGWGQGAVLHDSALLRGGLGGTSRSRGNGGFNGHEKPEAGSRSPLSDEKRVVRQRQIIELLHQRHDEFLMCFKQCDLERLREISANGGLQNSTIRSLVWLRLLGGFQEIDSLEGIYNSKSIPVDDDDGFREKRSSERTEDKNRLFASWVQSLQDHREEYMAIRSNVLVSSKDIGSRVSAEVDEAASTNSSQSAFTASSGTNVVGAAALAAGVGTRRDSPVETAAASTRAGAGANESPSPLSEDTAGAIFQYLVKSDYARQIWKDVTRTQQTIAWFVQPETQKIMHRILLVWSLAHQDIGYKQGMNEILAVLLYLICTERGGLEGEGHAELRREIDASLTESTDGAVSEHPFHGQEDTHSHLDVMLDPAFCEHDAYLMFSLMMVRMEGVFCPTDETPSVPSLKRGSRASASSLLQRFSRVQAEIVHLQNPDLAEHMIMQGVEPHMYLLRWMRLLCSREFAMPGLWFVWDAIIAVNSETFEFNDFICAALVLSLKDSIMKQEDSQGILQELQHFNQYFNIDIMRLLDLARAIKTRLTGTLLDSMNLEEV